MKNGIGEERGKRKERGRERVEMGRSGEREKETETGRGNPWFLLTPPDMKSWIKH